MLNVLLLLLSYALFIPLFSIISMRLTSHHLPLYYSFVCMSLYCVLSVDVCCLEPPLSRMSMSKGISISLRSFEHASISASRLFYNVNVKFVCNALVLFGESCWRFIILYYKWTFDFYSKLRFSILIAILRFWLTNPLMPKIFFFCSFSLFVLALLHS